jgi:hypothetical protein
MFFYELPYCKINFRPAAKNFLMKTAKHITQPILLGSWDKKAFATVQTAKHVHQIKSGEHYANSP